MRERLRERPPAVVRFLAYFVTVQAASLVWHVTPVLAAWPNNPSVNLPVCTAGGTQDAPAASRSEIVVPILQNGELRGVLDVDAPEPDRLDEEDRKGLEAFVATLVPLIDWPAVQSGP